MNYGGGVSIGGLHSKNGSWIDIFDPDPPGASPGTSPGKKGKKGKTKPDPGPDIDFFIGDVSLENPHQLFDQSRPYITDATVTGHLGVATHFCHNGSKLTPAGRQYLRSIVCDQLALYRDTHTQIVILGHTDRVGSFAFNQLLSEERAINVRTALGDFLGFDQRELDAIPAVGLSQDRAIAKDLLKALRGQEVRIERTPEYRRVDVLLNGSLSATFRDAAP
jgi:outer membrane protein OmpA-like peptidoglycan-associated protein